MQTCCGVYWFAGSFEGELPGFLPSLGFGEALLVGEAEDDGLVLGFLLGDLLFPPTLPAASPEGCAPVAPSRPVAGTARAVGIGTTRTGRI